MLGDTTLGLADVQLMWLVLALAVATTLGDRGPLRRLAAPLQVHLGGGRHRAAAADLRLRVGRRRPAADAAPRAVRRPAVRAAQGDPRGVPGRLPLGEPPAARSSRTRGSGRSACRRCRTSRRWSRCGRSPSGIVVVQRDLGAALLFFAVFLALTYAATGRLSLVIIGLRPVPRGQRAHGQPVRARRATGSTSGSTRSPIRWAPATRSSRRSTRSPAAGLLGTGLGSGLPMVGGRPPIPEVHTDFPLAALGEELGLVGVIAILGLFFVVIERGLRIGAAAADDFRAILATGLALVVGRPGVHHRGRQPQGPAADRRDAAVRQLRRLVAAGQRRRRRPAARPVRRGRRAAAAADRGPPAGAAGCAGGRA